MCQKRLSGRIGVEDKCSIATISSHCPCDEVLQVSIYGT
jgi:hypothetical protein